MQESECVGAAHCNKEERLCRVKRDLLNSTSKILEGILREEKDEGGLIILRIACEKVYLTFTCDRLFDN